LPEVDYMHAHIRKGKRANTASPPLPRSLCKCCLQHWWGQGNSCGFCSLRVPLHLIVALRREYTKESMEKVRVGSKNKISACFSCYFLGYC